MGIKLKMTIKQLSIKILNIIKAYCRKVSDLQREAIEFQSEIEKELWKDKK